jgi:vanillate O-demethylase monooxygenase subunit
VSPDTAAAVGIDNLEPALRRFWHPVATVGELGPAPLPVELLGQHYVLVRMGEDVRAFEDRCPHRHLPLSAGRLVDGELECAYHGYRFDGAGRCTVIPAREPGGAPPAGASLTGAWGVQERYGLVWLAPEEPRLPLPAFPEWDEDVARVPIGPHRWHVGAAQATDNFLDVSHFPFVHAGTFGDSGDTVVPEIELERDGLCFSYGYSHLAVNPDEVKALHAGSADTAAGDTQTRVMTFRFSPPFTLVAGVHYVESGLTDTVFMSCQPENGQTTRLFSWLMGPDVTADPVLARDYEEKILLEDQWVLERFREHSMPLDLPAQFHTRADRMTVEYRRVLAEIVADR